MPDRATATNALYVRLPADEAERLDRAAERLGTNKKALVTSLVARYVDPDTPAGLDALRALGPAAAATPRRVTIDMPGDRLTLGSHAFRPAEPAEVLTPAQAADLLQVPEDEIVRLAEAGELPGRRIGAAWRFSRSALVAWLAVG
jgi:excisionase family DNA binding protein